MMIRSFSIGCALSVFTLFAQADTTLKTEYKEAGRATAETAQVHLSAGKLAVQQADGKVIGYYDSALDTLTAIDHRDKAYYQLDPSLATSVGEKINATMNVLSQQMEAALAGMSAEQREKIKAMLPQAMTAKPAAPPAPVTVKKTSQTLNIAGVQCTVNQIVESGKQTGHACVAANEALGLSAGEQKTIQKLALFAGRLAKLSQLGKLTGMTQAGLNPISMSAAFDQLQGIPLAMESGQHSTKITAISHRAIKASVFKVPASYQKKNLMRLLGGLGAQ